MKINSATFVKGVVDSDNLIKDDLPQVAFIGRSNVGKSSLINTLTNNGKLARSSSTAGRTQEINFFLINNTFYLVDLPGYGYARGSFEARGLISERILGYLFKSDIKHSTVVLLLDSKAGMTDTDIEMFTDLKRNNKKIVIVINKIDKLNQSEKQKNINAIRDIVGTTYPIVLFSSVKKIGVEELSDLLFG